MSDVDFKQALADAGIPTTEEGLRKAWEAEVAAQGSKLSNTGAYSPFWRVITALVTKPVLWLIGFVSDTILPNFFVKTARDKWLDMLAWCSSPCPRSYRTPRKWKAGVPAMRSARSLLPGRRSVVQRARGAVAQARARRSGGLNRS